MNLHHVRQVEEICRNVASQLVAVKVELLEELEFVDAGGDGTSESINTHVPKHHVG
eukprot:XP_001710244.1 Hypothetical protein GL50803_38475 [Giardia lamblia ATCC 50803]